MKNKVEVKCKNCGNIRYMTQESSYEAGRLNKTLCRSCAQHQRPKRISKYFEKIKIGMQFGKWSVVSDMCNMCVDVKCECGLLMNIRVDRLLRGRSHCCRKCAKGKDSNNWRGVGDLPMTTFTKIKLRAKYKNIEFNLTPAYLWDLYLTQNKKCAISNFDIDFSPSVECNLSNTENISASLDRIDSNLGYIIGNVQWVYYKVNIMKNEYSQEEFINLCKIVSKNNL